MEPNCDAGEKLIKKVTCRRYQKDQASEAGKRKYLMSRYEEFERASLQLGTLSDRGCDLNAEGVAVLRKTRSPMIDGPLRAVASSFSDARRRGQTAVLMIGGHPIKLGLSRFLIDLMERGFISLLATNGAGLIHDFELAAYGGTSEDVAKWIKVGQFGLWRETGRLNDVVCETARRNEGLGEGLGRYIEEQEMAHRDISIAAAGWRCGVPVTCHVSIGSDIFHGYPNCDGAALGKVSYTDFLIFARQIQNLDGGVFLNVGSAVTGPEVYLKALSMARNVARQKQETITDFTTAVFDVVDLPENWQDGPGPRPQGDGASVGQTHPLYYYRPWKTILCRTVADGGRSYYVRGDHRETIPTLWHYLVNGIPEDDGPGDGR
jgi:hypothetical protein